MWVFASVMQSLKPRFGPTDQRRAGLLDGLEIADSAYSSVGGVNRIGNRIEIRWFFSYMPGMLRAMISCCREEEAPADATTILRWLFSLRP